MKKHPKQLKLSASGKLTVALSLFFVATQAMADIQPVSKTPTQVIKQGSIEIVNIANPSASGLSHNKYYQYNVDKNGAVLNNALQAGQSQLAGKLEKNPLLENAAKVILNEVITRNPSLLLGKQEVFGMTADYVLANQGGITCDNCGFINTPRASLVAGRPVVNEGKLTGYETDKLGSRVMITGELRDTEILDLIAPRIEVNGTLKASEDINLVIGQNHLTRDDKGHLSVKNVRNGVMDGKILGSIQANRIRIHAPNERSRVNIETSHLDAKEVSLIAGNATFKGKFEHQNERTAEKTLLGNGVHLDQVTLKRDKTYIGNSIKADHVEMGIANKLDLTTTHIQAKTAKIHSGEIKLASQVSEHYKQTENRQSKGLWYHTYKDTQSSKEIHKTTIHADKLDMLASNGKISGVSTDLKAKELKLSAKKGVDFKGSTSERYSQTGTGWANESNRLKTGGNWDNSQIQTYEATKLTADNLLIETNGDVKLAGVVSHVTGKTLINADKSVTLSPEISEQIQDIRNTDASWGGLAGSHRNNKGQRVSIQNGADLVSEDTLLINAKEGINIKGSRVIAKNGAYVNSGRRNLVIDSTINKETHYVNQRTGGILNVATHRYHENNQNYTTKGSEVRSETELRLLSDRDLNVIGSKIDSLGVLALKASQNININASTQKKINDTQTHTFSAFSKIDTLSLQEKEFQASSNLDFFDQRKTDTHINHTASNITGGQVDITANQKLTLSGSHIIATNGNLELNADKIKTVSVINSHHHKESQTDTKLGITGGINPTGIPVSIGINTTHKANTQTENQAQASHLTTTGNLNLHGKEIRHQGSKLTAQQMISETADNIHHTATTNSTVTKDLDLKVGVNMGVNVGLNFSEGLSLNKIINGTLAVDSKGNSKTNTKAIAKGTELRAENIKITANNTLHDTGTQYSAKSDVKLTAQDLFIEAAQNSHTTQTHQGVANLGVEASTPDLHTVNLKVNVAGQYQNQKDQLETPNNTIIHANNVAFQADTLHTEANIQADKVSMQANQQLVLSQSTSQEQHIGGGFDTQLTVGATIVPGASAVIPHVDVGVGVKGKNDTTYHGHANTIHADTVNLTSPENTVVQGTHLQANNLTVTGKEVAIKGVETTGKTLGLALSANSKALGGRLKLEQGNKEKHHTTDMTANTLDITSQTQVTITSANINADKLNIQAKSGNTLISAGQNSDQHNTIDSELSLTGSLHDNTWQFSGGKAKLKVDMAKNENITASHINAKNTTIHTPKNLNIHASHLTADTLNGLVGENVVLSENQNSQQKTLVDIAVEGSGKPALYTNGHIIEGLRKDFHDGSILGLKLDAQAKVHHQDEVTNNNVSLNSEHNQLQIKGDSLHFNVGEEHASEFNLNAEVSSDMKKNWEKLKKIKETGIKPFFNVSYIEKTPSK